MSSLAGYIASLLILGLATCGSSDMSPRCLLQARKSSSPAPASHHGSDEGATEKARHELTMRNPEKTRFPFDLVFWQHLPKTGGTATFDAVQILCQSRGQSLLVCYNYESCDSHDDLSEDARNGLADGVAVPWTRPENTANVENQIVYGHGLAAGFEKYWGLTPSPRNAWIRVFRDPISALISLWSFKQRQGYTNLSLNEWVESGNAEACTDMYFAYLVDLGRLDPSGCHWTNARPDAEQIVTLNNASILNAAVQALQAPNSLVLLHGRTQFNMDRLSAFLQLTPEEVAVMSESLGSQKNRAPPQELSLLVSNLKRLELTAEPLQFVLDEVKRLDHHLSAEVAMVGSKAQVVSQVGGEVTLHVSLD